MAETSQNLLLESVKKCNIPQAKLLLDRGADPNYVNEEEGVSPMHLAAGLGVEPLCLLLQYCGDPNIRLEDGTTPVHIAAIWGFADCMQILLANGGDPFLTDQDGLRAEDLAIKYQHDDVLQVLKHYMFLLSSAEEHTMTPMFTYRRLSVESTSSGSSSLIECTKNCSNNSIETSPDDSVCNTQDLQDYLQQFARRRRSSLYLRSVQKQCDKYFKNGQKTHFIDVTSPDHPYIERREPAEQVNESEDDSTTLHLSPTDASSDSFVTCDGESVNQELHDESNEMNSSLCYEEESPLCEYEYSTVKKNPKYLGHIDGAQTPHGHRKLFPEAGNIDTVEQDKRGNQSADMNNRKRSGEYRRTKYCNRKSPSPLLSQDKHYAEEECDFCGGHAEKHVEHGTVCAVCEKLGLELDELVEASGDYSYSAGFKQDMLDSLGKSNEGVKLESESLPDLLETLPETSKKASYIGNRNNWLFLERRKVFERDKILEPFAHKNIEQNAKKGDSYQPVCEFQKSEIECRRDFASQEIDNLTSEFESTHINLDPFRNTQSRDVTPKSEKEEIDVSKPNDSIVSHISSTVNELDKAHMCNDSILTLDETFLDRLESFSEKQRECTFQGGHLGSSSDQKFYNKEKRKCLDNVYKLEDNSEYPCSLEYNDLWRQVQECKHENLARRNYRDILDTAFCGRQSMNSILSDASTIDYIYTDKENGITLVERHLPSLCGSQGSRRSVDSQFSTNTDLAVGSDSGISKRSNRCSVSSEDTVLYNWKENAMLKSNDSGNGSSEATGSTPLSQELLNLDNQTLRAKLCCLGDDPGPVTTTTRQAYLRRFSQIQNDPDHKLLTCKTPEYPLELRQALNGNLDMSEMQALETKMVAAFQNPDRLRRWREGTLKSSFNYILLDPRVTRNLPNRAVNLSDQDVFQTFVSATFYIGKGKRARPYSHLYEAIKQQQKNVDKMSKKVEKILEIWNCGMGVVSLHCFQSVIPVEAYTREACMIDAIGLNHITNQKKGDYYGVSVTFSMKERRKMGVYQLKKALQIFLAEGERQIAPLDIKND